MRIILVDINISPSQQLAQQFNNQGLKAIAIYADLAKPEDRTRIIDKAMEHFGRIDFLINNAGYAYIASAEDIDLDQGHHQFEVNFWATVDLAKRVIPIMKKQRGGTILNIGSLAGLRKIQIFKWGIYAATKKALIGFTETMAFELRNDNINVKVACPGGMKTNIITNSIGSTYSKKALKTMQEVINLAYESPDFIAVEIFKKINQKETVILPGRATQYEEYVAPGKRL